MPYHEKVAQDAHTDFIILEKVGKMGEQAKMPKKFTENGMTYEQEEKRGNWYIYSQFSVVHKKILSWEVVKPVIRKANTNVIDGKEINFDGGEYYPQTREWGINGFTCIGLSEARAKADKMSEQENKKK